ncbi:hypothetical protein J6590_015042 [Homalodisca vitripennis]|nr:hypothetical protein J6590_015042 [Homalodisca vitripennis]
MTLLGRILTEGVFSRPSGGPKPEPVADAVSASEAAAISEALPTAEALPRVLSSAVAYSFSKALPEAFARAFPKPIPEPYATAIAMAKALPMLEEVLPMLATQFPEIMEWIAAALGVAAL